jgi:DNA polymerase-3 subunit epsilon
MTDVNDFFAVDVETANTNPGSICSIGLVHLKAGAVFQSLAIRIDPEDRFDTVNIRHHGITPHDVIGKPTMARVFPVLNSYLNNTIVTHHGRFDRTAFDLASAKYNVAGPDACWIDTVTVARHTWPDLAVSGGYGLANLSRIFDLELLNHDVVDNARASGLIMLRAIQETNSSLQGCFDQLALAPELAEPETDALPEDNATSTAPPVAPNGKLAGEVVVFTGFLKMTRSDIAKITAQAGCEVSRSVDSSVTILVVGDQDVRLTRGIMRSGKHREAERINAAGGNIRIIGESDFVQLVG